MKLRKVTGLALALVLLLSVLAVPAAAASDKVYSQNTNINSPFNGFDNVTVKAGVKVAIGKGGGLEVRKILAVEKGGSITGADKTSVLLFRGGAASSGITLYYNHQGTVKELPYGVQRLWETGYSTDTPANFVWQSGKWVLEGVISGGDAFTTEDTGIKPQAPEDDAPHGPVYAGDHINNQGKSQEAADKLNKLGLLSGTGVNADGSINYDLFRTPGRAEAIVMLIRLLGEEQAALNGSWSHPFTDVPAWADKYVGYGYEKKYTGGVSATQFGTADADARQYLTFVLRAMGYSDANGADFRWDDPYALAMSVGVLTGDVDAQTFWRGDMAIASFNALEGTCKDGRKLKDKLIAGNVFSAGDYVAVTGQAQQPGDQPQQPQQAGKAYAFVSYPDNTYKTAAGNVTASLTSGMSSDLRLLANNIGVADEKYYDHPSGIAMCDFEGYHYYFAADTWNNRVLIYRTQGTEAWNANTPIYRILGQTSATASTGGYSMDKLNYPVGVAAGVDRAGKLHIYVADANNNRVMVWEGMPAKDGQAADFDIRYLVDPKAYKGYKPNAKIGEAFRNETDATMAWPWAIWTDGEKLIVTATRSGYVGFWDQLPTKTDKYTDKALYVTGTPRTITTDGKGYLVLSNHNTQVGDRVVRAAQVYKNVDSLFAGGKTYAVSTGDVVVEDLYAGGVILKEALKTADGGTLPAGALLLNGIGSIQVWKDGKIDSADDRPDYHVGGGVNEAPYGYKFASSDFNVIAVDSTGNLYTTVFNESRVVGYSAGNFPAEPKTVTAEALHALGGGDSGKVGDDYYLYVQSAGVVEKHAGAIPDLCVGQKSVTVDAFVENFQFQNCTIATDGRYFVVGTDNGNHILLWRNVPDESGARPDAMFTFCVNDALNPIDMVKLFQKDGKTGLMAGDMNSIFVWQDIEKAFRGEEYDLHYIKEVDPHHSQIGATLLGASDVGTIYDFDFDGEYFYLLSSGGLYLFKGFPAAGDSYVKKDSYTGSLGRVRVTNCADGKVRFVVAGEYDGFAIYERDKVLSATGTIPKNKVTVINARGMEDWKNVNGIYDAMITQQGQVIAAESSRGRVVIWSSVADAVGGKQVAVVLGKGTNAYTAKDLGFTVGDPVPYQTENTLAQPYYVEYDGNYLWVGEFKFSGGIRRFAGILGN